ncbi:hypothetical protein PENSPDRAFT_694569 [Peniophora sp. CONT]|nr:hypothetical protein PENSPDRAFT_694569 [Peniophora sp. CONT]
MSSAGTLLHQLIALQSTTLISAGLFFHEFVAHLQYDWELFKRPEGGRPIMARLAKWSYLACRTLTALYSVCIHAFTFPEQPNCHCELANIALVNAAVWAWDKRIISLLALNVLAFISCTLYDIVVVKWSYDSAIHYCALKGVHMGLAPSMALFVGDCVTLALLLVGLVHWRDARQFRMWQILWAQGIIYLVIAALIEIPSVVLLIKNIDPTLDAIFFTPEVVFLPVCATRMFRFLNMAVRSESGEDGNHETFTNGVSQFRAPSPRDDGIQMTSVQNGHGSRERL